MLVVCLFEPRPWIRDGSAAGRNGLDGIISGWMKRGFDEGVDGKGGAVYFRDSSKGDRMRETRKKQQRTLTIILFLSKSCVTAAEVCFLLLPLAE